MMEREHKNPTTLVVGVRQESTPADSIPFVVLGREDHLSFNKGKRPG